MPDEISPATQTIEESALSPQCHTGQHEACKHRVSYIPEDGNARTLVCPCRCHDRAPVFSGDPQHAYLISWEYLHVDAGVQIVGEDPPEAWLSRRVLTNSKDIAGEWLDGCAALMETHKVRNLSLLKAVLGDWEKVG